MSTTGMKFSKKERRKRSKRWFIIKGKDKTMMEWCVIYGISQSTVTGRIKRGWPMDENLFQPSDEKYKNKRCKAGFQLSEEPTTPESFSKLKLMMRLNA